jgi:hypothetical protein
MAADFAALVSRGLDPFRIPGEPQSVFDYTVWMILDGMLRRHPQGDFRNDRGGFKLAIQQEVLDFICTQGRRLKEISPRMAYKLAAARRDDPSWEQAWEEQLKPKALWHGLILPDDPPRLLSPSLKRAQMQTPEPPEADAVNQPVSEQGRATFSDKAIATGHMGDLHGNAAREPPSTTPEPSERAPAPILALPPPEPLTYGQAIHAVYDLPSDQRTCDAVADIFGRCSLTECNEDYFGEITHALEGVSKWSLEHVEGLAHHFAYHGDGPLLFCTAHEVLVWEGPDKGLQIYRWDVVARLMAPHIAESKRKAEAMHGRREAEALLKKRLPEKRKLKAVKAHLHTLIDKKLVQFNDERIVEYIHAMTTDDPRFGRCRTLKHYIDAVGSSFDASSGEVSVKRKDRQVGHV